jgi:hypothetical protein
MVCFVIGYQFVGSGLLFSWSSSGEKQSIWPTGDRPLPAVEGQKALAVKSLGDLSE